MVIFLGCGFQDEGQFGGAKQVRVTEDTAPGTQIFIVKAYPRRLFTIQALDGVSFLLFVRLPAICV